MNSLLRPLVAVLMASAVCLSAGTYADWQGTVWNSSVEQTDKDFRVPHRPPTPAEIQNWLFGEIKIAFDYTVDDLDFHKGALLFKDGKLFAISMELKEKAQCPKLIEILRRLYGSPAEDEAGSSARFITWYDEKNRNRVHLNYNKYGESAGIEPDCRLQYEAFIVPAPGKL